MCCYFFLIARTNNEEGNNMIEQGEQQITGSRKKKNIPGIGRIFIPRWRRAGGWRESPHWWVAYYHRGKEYRENALAETEAQALKFLKERVKALGRGQVKPKEEKVTFDMLAADFVTDYEVNKKRSVRSAKLSVSHLRHFFGFDKALAGC
jgi:hypothetical protein